MTVQKYCSRHPYEKVFFQPIGRVIIPPPIRGGINTPEWTIEEVQIFKVLERKKLQQYRNIFNEPVSVFTASSYITNDGRIGTTFGGHHVRTLGQFLGAGGHYARTIARLRATLTAALAAWQNGDRKEYDRLLLQYSLHKWDSPLAILQGVCPSHKNDGFESYADIVCLDIDTEKPHKGTNGNEWVQSWTDLRDEIAKNPFVAYCGLSVGGRGLFVLIPIKSHERHHEHWRALCTLFRKVYGLTIDKATENMARLRFMSFDPDAWVNTRAAVFEGLEREKKALVQLPRFTPGDNTEERIEKAVLEIEQRGIDITQSHDEWKKAGAAIAHYMGERGRSIFHRIAAQYPGYNERENEKLYNNLLRSYAGRQADIATFFYLCKAYGVNVWHKHDMQMPQVAPVKRRVSAEREQPRNSRGTVEEHKKSGIIMSAAENAEFESRETYIREGMQLLSDIEREQPAVEKLRKSLGLIYCGHNGWQMTEAQFDKFMREHPQPPF